MSCKTSRKLEIDPTRFYGIGRLAVMYEAKTTDHFRRTYFHEPDEEPGGRIPMIRHANQWMVYGGWIVEDLLKRHEQKKKEQDG